MRKTIDGRIIEEPKKEVKKSPKTVARTGTD